jgi:hypothetical protein
MMGDGEDNVNDEEAELGSPTEEGGIDEHELSIGGKKLPE